MTRLLSFIGIGDLKEADYRFDHLTFRTRFAQEALCEFFHPDEMILFATEKAHSVNCKAIHDACSKKIPAMRIVSIPDGADREELWTIFSIICSEVQQGDTLIFDLTHSFRTLPFICFLSVAYLKDIKHVTIERIIYGRLEPDADGTSPFIDITDFSTILDWMMAIHTFTRQVDARELSALVVGIHKQAHRSQVEKKPKVLEKWAGNLNLFSSSVLLSRPIDAAKAAQGLVDKLDAAKEEVNQFIPALVPVMDEIREIGDFAQTADSTLLTKSMLDNQWRIIEYQKKSGLILQAVELTREWFVNYIILRLNYEPEKWLKLNTRNCIEKTLNYQKGAHSNDTKNMFPTKIQGIFCSLPDVVELVSYWSELSELRNNLAHCGMNRDETPINRLLGNATTLLDRVGSHYHRFPIDPKMKN
jgi:hypothetical protein